MTPRSRRSSHAPAIRAAASLERWLLFLLLCLGAGCGSGDPPSQGAGAKSRTLTLGAYTTPREVYGKAVIPAFQKHWKEKTGETIQVQASYLGSGAQARAIIGGFEADVAALSLEPDIEAIVRAGLIKHDWKAGPGGGMVTRSIVVLAVREGNPRGIKEWDDLRRPGLAVLTPNVRTSGGAMWNIAAMYGAALRGHTSAPKGDERAAEQLIRDVLKNVVIMDKGARESMITFEKGVGEVAITYENEVLVGRKAGRTYEYVVPKSTIRIENPAAVVDSWADKHGNRDLAEGFISYLRTAEAQRAFAGYGLRPVDEALAGELEAPLPPVQDLFTVRDLGDWPKLHRGLFEAGGLYERAMGAAGGGR